MKNFKLDEQPKISSGFNAPDDYFENLSASVILKINTEEPKVIPLYKRPKLLWSAVAAVLIAAVSIPLLNQNETPQQPDSASIENYLTYHSNISEDDIASLLTEKDLENMDNDIKLEDKAIEEVLLSDDFEDIID